jgi:thioredoxin-like negative regulator of GroEL
VTSLSAALLLYLPITARSAGTDTYADAYRLTSQTGRPMVVFVSAEWCPACQTMKRNVIPQIRERGLLGKVAFAIVNLDRERDLGHKLTRGGPIPQLLMYRKTPDGWRLSRLIGAQKVPAVERFIDWGLKRDEATRKENTVPDAQPGEETAVAKKAQSASDASRATR